MQRFSMLSIIAIIAIMAVLVCIADLIGCASGSKKKPEGAEISEKSELLTGVPDWFGKIPEDPNYLFAHTTQSSKDLQLAINKAVHEGRVQIAQQVQTKVSGLVKLFIEDVGATENLDTHVHSETVFKSIVSESLTDIKINKQEVIKEGSLYRAYIQMVMPVNEVSLSLRDNIKNDQPLYQKFRASQGYQELEKEAGKYEEWKKQQGQ